jgi:hypothetical protein
MSNLIPFPQPLPLRLPTIEGCVDYRQFESQLHRIDGLLRTSGLETQFITLSVDHWLAQKPTEDVDINPQQQIKFQEHSRRALRCNIVRTLLQQAFRKLAVRLADSPLLQWFCGLGQIDKITVPSKSTLQRYETWLPEDQMRPIMEQLLCQGRDQAPLLQLKEPLDLEAAFLDCTCVKADIHFPVDWLLLRDATRTLMQATDLIRQQGLKHRMAEPASFITRMNQLCIKMTHSARKPDSKKQRKKVLREMKSLTQVVRVHAQRYRALLDEQWAETDWTRPQAEQVLRRLDNVLSQLPAALHQAHERIIGERLVKNEDKILSLYEPDVQVVVRHKAGAEVEFGNSLLLAESPQGLILHWELFPDGVPADASLVKSCVRRIETGLQEKLQELGTDRGFDSAANRQWLGQKKIFNGMCPRSPEKLEDRMAEPRFAGVQKRRSQTEGRISILQNNFLGRPLRVKGFAHRSLAVAWGVLTHNLWVMARLPQAQSASPELCQAA